MTRRSAFGELCAALDSPGGHMLACFAIITMGLGALSGGLPIGRDMVVGGLGAFFGALKGQNGKGATA